MHTIHRDVIKKYLRKIDSQKYHTCFMVKDLRNPFDYQLHAFRMYLRKEGKYTTIDPYYFSDQNKTVLNSEECSDEEMISILEKMIKKEI